MVRKPGLPPLFGAPWERQERTEVYSLAHRYMVDVRFRESIDEVIAYEWAPLFSGRRAAKELPRGSNRMWIFDFPTLGHAKGFLERVRRLRSLDSHTDVYEGHGE